MATRVTDQVEISDYLISYFNMVEHFGFEKIMNNFKDLIGFSGEYVHLFFKKSLEGVDWKAYKEIGDERVRLEYDLIGSGIYMYIDFVIFYNSLEQWLEEKYFSDVKILGLLKKVKEALGIEE